MTPTMTPSPPIPSWSSRIQAGSLMHPIAGEDP